MTHVTPQRLELEPRASLEEALERDGLWLDWPAGVAEPAPPVFWGADIPERMLVPHREPAPYPAMELACIAGAVVRNEGFLADASGNLYLSDALFPRYLNNWIETGERPAQRPPLSELEEIALPGVSALVHHCHCDIYGHWLVEGLPKLLFLSALPIKPARFLMHAGARTFIADWIRHVAPDVEIAFYDPARQYVRCATLITPTLACSHQYVFNPALNPLLERIAPRRPATRLLYLDRQWPGVYHWMINADEVRSAAQSFGFEVYFPAKHSVLEQIEAFAGARVLAADYGSALHNSLFSQPSTRVLAFNWVTAIQSRIAQLRGQRVGFQLGETGDRVIIEGYRLDLDAAKRAFEAALDT